MDVSSSLIADRLMASARRQPRSPVTLRNDRPLVALVGLGLVGALGLGTQYVAWRYAFHSNLGAPLLVLGAATCRRLRAAAVICMGMAIVACTTRSFRRLAIPLGGLALMVAIGSMGRVYAPDRLLRWQLAYVHDRRAAAIVRQGWIIAGTLGVVIELLTLAGWRSMRRHSVSDAFGTAHWGTGDVLHRDSGLILGRQGTRLLRLGGEGHVLTVAPTRSGKGVSCVIPALLSYPGSILVTDPKGENYAVTARWRRECGQRVHALDPFGVVGGSATLNPLDLVDATSPGAIDDARMLADMLVIPEGRERDEAFWNEEARGLLTGLILHVAAKARPPLRTLTHVRTLLTLPPVPFQRLLTEMSESPAVDGLVARAAARVAQKADRERSGVISTAQSHTHFLDSARMRQVLARSTADFMLLKRERATVYLVLPPDRLDSYARWMRLMIASALLAMTRTPGQPAERVLFLLDEFPHLGKMAPVQRDIGLVGGYGARFWLIVQDLSQLRTTYGEAWPTFLSNVDALQAFGTADWDTSEYLSKMTGEATIQTESENESAGVSRGRHPQRQRGAARTVAEKGRRLLLPDEVRRLPREWEVLFVKGSAPLLMERVDYRHDPMFRGRADPNPLYDRVGSSNDGGASVRYGAGRPMGREGDGDADEGQ